MTGMNKDIPVEYSNISQRTIPNDHTSLLTVNVAVLNTSGADLIILIRRIIVMRSK